MVRVLICPDPGSKLYSMWMASTGHSSTQLSQSTHASASTTARSSFIVIAALGQISTQLSQPVHFSLSTIATNRIPPNTIFIKNMGNRFRYEHPNQSPRTCFIVYIEAG